jgi:phosphopantothenoylcysteine decarboxylase/phosphopantothenate--cysteine ligase
MLITAGPTHEPIDAVRYISNRSSGRLGIALAEAAIRRGLPATLLMGPTPLAPPRDSQLTTIRFRTAADLQRLLATHWPHHDVLIMAAAVADYRPTGNPPAGKRPRGDRPWSLDLEPTPDLLEELAAITRPDQTVIGFALEPAERLPEAARGKLVAKRLAAIVANPLETMESDRIEATVLLRDGRTLTPPAGARSKLEFAGWLLDELETIVGGEG